MKWMEKVDPDLRRLYRYFLPHKWRLAVAVVFLMGSASMSSVTATLLGKMTDIGFYHQEGWIIYAAPLALIGVTLGFAICTVMSTVLMAKVSQAVLVKLRMQLFESILHWPEAEYQRNTTGRIVPSSSTKRRWRCRERHSPSSYWCVIRFRSWRCYRCFFGMTGNLRL